MGSLAGATDWIHTAKTPGSRNHPDLKQGPGLQETPSNPQSEGHTGRGQMSSGNSQLRAGLN